MKVTDVPEQILVPGDADTATLTERGVLTDMVIMFEVAGLPVTQAAFDVIFTVTWSPFASVDEEYVLLLVPTLLPLTFHW